MHEASFVQAMGLTCPLVLDVHLRCFEHLEAGLHRSRPISGTVALAVHTDAEDKHPIEESHDVLQSSGCWAHAGAGNLGAARAVRKAAPGLVVGHAALGGVARGLADRTGADDRHPAKHDGASHLPPSPGLPCMHSVIAVQAMATAVHSLPSSAVPAELVALLGKRVQLRGPASRHSYGGGHWHLYNNSRGTAAASPDTNSMEDLRLPVIFEAGAEEASEGSDGVRLDIPIKHLVPLPAWPSAAATSAPVSAASGRAARFSASRPFFLTFATARYHHWLCHLHTNVRLLGFSSSALHVCTPDEETRRLALERGMRVCSPDSFNTSLREAVSSPSGAAERRTRQRGRAAAPGGHTFKSAAFAQMTLRKQACLWGMLRSLPEGGVYLFLDADVTLLRSPFEALALAAGRAAQGDVDAGGGVRAGLGPGLGPGLDPGFDMAIQDDSNGALLLPEMNLGFLLLANTPATRAFGDFFVGEVQKHPTLNDQSVFNGVLRTHSHRLRLRLRTMRPSAFPNGFRYYERRVLGALPYAMADDFSRLVAVHHNWISGDLKKWARAVHYGAIAYPNDTHATFATRMRAGFDRLPWVYRRPVVFPPATAAEAGALQRRICARDPGSTGHRTRFRKPLPVAPP